MAKEEKKPLVEDKPKVEKEEMIEVKKRDLDGLLERLDKMQKDQDLLFKASDKTRLSAERAKGESSLIKTVKISKWSDTDKFVIGWKLVSNRAEVVMGRWVEEQSTLVMLDDGETVTVPLLEFYRSILRKEVAEITSRKKSTQNNIDTEIFEVRFENGRVLEIDSKYVN